MKTITLETYGKYDKSTDNQDIICFSVPQDWLIAYLKANENWYKDWKYSDDEMIFDYLGKYTWDEAELILEEAEKDLYEIIEVCPHCMAENTPYWDVGKYGYEITCIDCGANMMLCDECMHAEDNEGHRCNWCEAGCFRKINN